MKKETMLIVASLLFVLGLLLCTGVDQNPWQAVIALPMMGGASWLFNRVDAMERKAGHKSLSQGYREAA